MLYPSGPRSTPSSTICGRREAMGICRQFRGFFTCPTLPKTLRVPTSSDPSGDGAGAWFARAGNSNSSIGRSPSAFTPNCCGASPWRCKTERSGEACPTELTRAKTAFPHTLENANIASQIVNPSAYFSDMKSVLKMAKRSKVRIFNPEIRLNPIHGADLAIYICDLMERDDK